MIDTTIAGRGPSGTAVYARRLAAALRAEGVEVIEVANERRRAPGGGLARSVSNWATDRRWTNRELPRLAREHSVDVLHHPLPAHCPNAPCPQVVTVQDLAFVVLPALFARRYALWAARAHRSAARRADAVICPSEATARDLRARWHVEAQVIGYGPGQLEEPVQPLERAAPRHFLYVGDDEPRKDLATVRAAADRSGQRLQLAGRAGVPFDARRLLELHAGAHALVHAALLEGFGLTLLEAMALGTPVIAARSEAAQELCGEAALFFEPGDVAALAATLERVAGDPALRDGLRERGLERARAFSWSSCARAHIAAYTLAGGS